jgi:hypothetical protein
VAEDGTGRGAAVKEDAAWLVNLPNKRGGGGRGEVDKEEQYERRM